jgi:hypothetical protein
MDIVELQELVPKHKSDWERAEAIVRLGYPAVVPILPQLLEWIQDYNWPVAHVLFPFLASIGEPLAPYVRDVLATNDTIWKAWIMGIVAASPPLAASLQAELQRLAAMIPQDEDEEWLLEATMRALHLEALDEDLASRGRFAQPAGEGSC